MARIFSTAPAWTGTIGSGGVPDASTTTIPLSSATGLTDGAYYVLSIDRVDASGNRTPAKWEVVAGQLSGTNLINCTRGVEGTAQAHSAGATVEVLFTSYHWEQLKEYLENDYILEKKASGSDINTGTEDAKIVTPKAIADSYLYTEGGWIPARETWTYASANSPTFTFTISGDKTTKYSPGMKIRLKQGGNYIYFIITAVSYSSPNTIITCYGGTDYTLTNLTITDNYYSVVKAPFGFPLNPDKWTIKVTQVSGIWTGSPTANTWYNGKSFSVPTGVWNLSYYTRPYNTYCSGYPSTMRVTISTTNNSETDSELTSNSGVTAGNDGSGFLYVDSILTSSKVITVNSTTTYYFNYGTTLSGMVAVGFSNLIIKLVSVYL